MKKIILLASALASLSAAAFSQSYFDLSPEEEAFMASQQYIAVDPADATITSTSTVDWSKETFSSKVTLDTNKARIPLPSGKSTAINKIQMQLPNMIKDPLLGLDVDDAYTLGDLVLNQSVTLEDITEIIIGSKQTPAIFRNGTPNLETSHTINMLEIGSLMIKHKSPWTQKQPIKKVASRAYSGIIIDARGTYDIHGEFTQSKISPCIFPKIYDEDMNLLYEKNMVDPEVAKTKAIVQYGSDPNPKAYSARIGNDPLWIKATKVFGASRVDPLISTQDFLKITSVKENLDLLRQGKVVIILDKDMLSHAVKAPVKDKNYYMALESLRKYFTENIVPDTIIIPSDTGLTISMENLRFIADSSELLPEERPRITLIANQLKSLVESSEWSILVEGHTADVNKPNGQMMLSVQRAQTIINLLIEDGLEPSLFSYKGYGGTKPIATNDTEEGRSQNRRVEITAMPKSSYVQTAQ